MEEKKRKYRIADVNVLMTTYYDKTAIQAESYEVDDMFAEGEEDVVICIPQDMMMKKKESELNGLTLNSIEYVCTGSLFYRYLLRHNGMLLHSSAVVVDGYAYLFSADSGTGKSTHTQLWMKHFKDKAYIINDDKPALRRIDNQWYVYGTPWSGKTDLNVNTRAKLGGIVFLERSENNWIEDMPVFEAVAKILPQTTRKLNKVENMDLLIQNINELLKDVPVYKFGCNISDEAVEIAYNKIRKV